MLGRQRNGVFLSYARKDGEDFAANLRARLQREAPDVVIKQDRLSLEGGLGWKQITDAIDAVEFLVLVMTPAAMASVNVQKEWRYARQQGVCVYPVKGAPDPELCFSELPRWMSKAHFFDLQKEWESFIAHLRTGCHTTRVPFMAPDLPPHFIERPAEFGALKNLLLRGFRKPSVDVPNIPFLQLPTAPTSRRSIRGIRWQAHHHRLRSPLQFFLARSFRKVSVHLSQDRSLSRS